MKRLLIAALSIVSLSAATSGCALDAQPSSESSTEVASQASALSGGVMSLATTNLGCNTQGSLTFLATMPTGQLYSLAMANPQFSEHCPLTAALDLPASYQVEIAEVLYQGNAFVSEGAGGDVTVSAGIGSAGLSSATQLARLGSTTLDANSGATQSGPAACNFDGVLRQLVSIQSEIPSNASVDFTNVTIYFVVSRCG